MMNRYFASISTKRDILLENCENLNIYSQRFKLHKKVLRLINQFYTRTSQIKKGEKVFFLMLGSLKSKFIKIGMTDFCRRFLRKMKIERQSLYEKYQISPQLSSLLSFIPTSPQKTSSSTLSSFRTKEGSAIEKFFSQLISNIKNLLYRKWTAKIQFENTLWLNAL